VPNENEPDEEHQQTAQPTAASAADAHVMACFHLCVVCGIMFSGTYITQIDPLSMM
jgi:hypothetical protein